MPLKTDLSRAVRALNLQRNTQEEVIQGRSLLRKGPSRADNASPRTALAMMQRARG